MFCDHCGMQVFQTQTFCSSCGKVIPEIPSRMAARGRIEGHLSLLAILWLAYSVARLAGGWLFATFFARFFSGFWSPHLPFIPGVLRGVGALLLAGAVLGVAAGWGLMERQPWARTLATVLAFFALVPVGIGTALGIYTLWVLLPEESAREYQGIARVV